MRDEARVLRGASESLADAGLRAGICVLDIRSGARIGLDGERLYPMASVVKLPLAMAVLQRADAGELDLAEAIDIPAAGRTTGPTGLSRFRFDARVALADLLYLAVGVSDNAAADVLFDRVPPREVTRALRARGHEHVTVRHPIGDLERSVADRLEDDLHLALALAARSATRGGDLIPQLDVTRANAASADALAQLLADIWTCDEQWAQELRTLLSSNVLRHRLAPDLESDAATWSSKTGTFLTLRHEVGVLEHPDGAAYAVAVLSESCVGARAQPAAEAALGAAARELLLHLDTRH